MSTVPTHDQKTRGVDHADHVRRLRYLREMRGLVASLAVLIGAITSLVVALVGK